MKQWLVALTAIFLGAACPTRADTIVFRTGERLTGTIVAEPAGLVIFDFRAMGRIEVPQGRILDLERDAAPTPVTSTSAEVQVAGTNTGSPKDFLRIYADHGMRYELVQPLASPSHANRLPIWSRKPFGFVGDSVFAVSLMRRTS